MSSLKTLLRTFSTMTNRTPRGAVAASGYKCAQIGAAILEKGGSAVDAAIASMLGEGVAVPNTMGLGGGFIMTVYIKDKGVVETLDAREVAPGGASEDMFCGDSSLSTKGGLAVAVPGELKGYWEVYKKYGGKVPWRDVVQPTIDLCNDGILVTEFVERVSLADTELLKNDECLRETFIDPKTNRPYPRGHCVTRPRLAKTLELIAENGADVLYDGSLTANFVQDICEKGGIITTEDMKNYKPEWRTPVKASLPCDRTLYTSPLPGSGVVLTLILNILGDFLDCSQPSSLTNWQRIVESFKFGFGRRTELGDPSFADFTNLVADLTSTSYAKDIRSKISDSRTCQNPDYYGAHITPPGHGTANICVLAPNGDAVAATSSINLDFGAGFMSKSTGIILNNVMDDFSSPSIISSYHMPPSEVNYIKPGKRPLSSMCPTVILGNNCDVEMVIGAAGGPKIITSITLALIKHLWYGVGIQAAVSDKRLHHQLFPMLIEFEESYKNDVDLVKALHEIGHDYKLTPSIGFNAVTAISRKGGVLEAAIDPRRGGEKVFVY